MGLMLSWNLAQPAIAESALLTKVRAGDNVKVVLLGTSLTANGTWPGSLQNWLSAESPGPGTVTVVNRAVSGKASDHGLATQTPLALTDNPDAVFIEFSMNDAATSLNITLQEAEDNLNGMIDAFKAQNPAVIIVLQTMNNLPPNTSPFSPRVNLNGYYQIYRNVAAARGAILIDHYPNWLDLYTNNLATWNSYMTDAVHPNALGQDAVLVPELEEVLGPPALPPTTPAATILFQDDFSGQVTAPLNGTTPDFTTASTTWVADTEYKANGAATTGQTSRRAYLTLGGLIDDNRGNPDATYTLSATLNVSAGLTGIWEAIGFWNENAPAENFGSSPSNGTAWMLRRDNAQLRVFRGTRTTNGITESTSTPNNLTGKVDLRVVLDLTSWNGTSSFGTVTYFAKLAAAPTYTEIANGALNATNSTFRAVGLGGGGVVAAKIDFFQLAKSPEIAPSVASFSYDRSDPDGASQVSIKGIPGTRFKLVEADDLDFTNPDQDPVPLTGATEGTLDGNEVILDANGNATVQFDLGISKSATFIRAQSIP
jgi:lysophospholipase L1-like esterase